MSSSPSNDVPDLELIKKRLEKLSGRQSLVLRLELIDELPNQTEIGKRMGIKQGSVSDHRKAALENLRVRPDDLMGLAVVKLALEQKPISPEEQQILDANIRQSPKPEPDGDESELAGTQVPPVNGQPNPPETGFGNIEQGIEDSRVAPPRPQLNRRLLAIAGGILAAGLVLGGLLGWLLRPTTGGGGVRIIVATPTPGPTQTPVVVTKIATPNATEIAAAVALLPTSTPEPTQTPWVVTVPPMVATPTAAEVANLQDPGLPTPQPNVTATPPVPGGTSQPNNNDNLPILEIGGVARNGDVELVLLDRKFETGTLYTKWRFTNNTNQQIAARFTPKNIIVKDNLGKEYASGLTRDPFGGCGGWDALVDPGSTLFNGGCEDNWLWTEFDTANCRITEMVLTATNVTLRIPEATWRIPINLCG